MSSVKSKNCPKYPGGCGLMHIQFIVIRLDEGYLGGSLMVKFEIYEFIRRTPEAVFDYFTDPANLPQWQSYAEHAEWVSRGEPGVGSVFKVVTSLGGSREEVRLQVATWERPYRYAFRSIEAPFPIKKLEGFTTLTVKENGTSLAFKGQISLSAFFKLGESLVSKQLNKQDGTNILLMKQALETGQSLSF
jgi:hypothetical protein